MGRYFKGFQRQKDKPTVQGQLEKALSILLKEKIVVAGSSRTDAGVNAKGQVANFRTSSLMPADRILKGLNGILPDGVVVTSAAEAADSFHARKDAVWREYEYLIWNRPYPDLFRREFAAHAAKPLDIGLMKEAARAARGEHDFTAFCVASSAHKGCVRKVMKIDVTEPEPGLVKLTIRADGFVHRMVRSLVGTLIDIGRGRIRQDTIARMLKTGDRKLAGRTAPANGLTLTGIGYNR